MIDIHAAFVLEEVTSKNISEEEILEDLAI